MTKLTFQLKNPSYAPDETILELCIQEWEFFSGLFYRAAALDGAFHWLNWLPINDLIDFNLPFSLSRENLLLLLWMFTFVYVISFSECQNYQSLNAADRKITYTTYHGYCDYTISKGWYRFEGAAGTRLPTSCTPDNRCGTHATGWLSNGHPSVADGRVSRQVCFSYGGTCYFGGCKNIRVRNCGSFYVYELVGTPSCHYRYCGTD